MESDIIFIVGDDPLVHFTAKELISFISPLRDFSFFSSPANLVCFLQANAVDTRVLPDVIILDNNTPVTDELEFLTKFRSLQSRLAKRPRLYVRSSTGNFREITYAKSDRNLAGFTLRI